jgi:acetyltransferase-like isoleucine patch superfamily enzyme
MRIKLFPLFLMFLPNPLKLFFLNLNPKHQIHPTAKIGLFTYLDATSIHLGEHTVIGHFNFCENLENFHIGSGCLIGNSNSFKALPLGSSKHFRTEADRDPSFYVGNEVSIGKSHGFDFCNSIRIGDFTAIAGERSSLLTHGIDMKENIQKSAPLSIGNYCRIGTCCVFKMGSRLPNYSVVGANSMVHKAFDEEYALYSGVPAKLVKKLDPSLQYFHREKGFVD